MMEQICMVMKSNNVKQRPVQRGGKKQEVKVKELIGEMSIIKKKKTGVLEDRSAETSN